MDQITAKADASKTWAKASEGQAQCVLVDVINLGMHPESYMGGPTRMTHKCALIWQIDEINPDTMKPFEMSKEFTVSMSEKANLRKFLGMWRGKTYSDEEALEKGAPLHLLYAVNGFMQIEHKQSKSNPERSYATIVSVTPLPKGMKKMEPLEYTRSDHWKEKIKQYEVADENDFPQPPDDDTDELPF